MVKKYTEISLNLRIFLVTPPGSHRNLTQDLLDGQLWNITRQWFLGILRGNFSIQVVDGADQVSQVSVLGQSVQGRPSNSSGALTGRWIQCPLWEGSKT